MIELLLTSFPFLIRIAYLRYRGWAITLYNVHRSVFIWICLFIALIFTIEYYHPDTHKALVPFRIVPVVPERSGTVTSIAVKPGSEVKEGDLLFTIEDSREKAAVDVAQTQIANVQAQMKVAQSEVDQAKSQVTTAQSALKDINITLNNQEELKAKNSPAFAEDNYERAKDRSESQQAVVDGANAQLATAQLKATQLLPAQLASAQAELEKAKVQLALTQVHSPVDGRIAQITLNVGDRASQVALSPSMVIIPDRAADEPKEIVAGFTQVQGTVIHPGMAAEVACRSNINNSITGTVLPVRVTRVQDQISSGQIAPSGGLLQPSNMPRPGDVVAFLELVYPEQQDLLIDGSACLVQAYTTKVTGKLAGTFLGEVIQAWALEKAVVMRMKVWIMLATGAGLGGEG
ncbi:HlyD family secretion protein [Chachezhania antarctica]|uniref:HlyD family secretion protein n=1 Tax=Chachezhania antarctica TaxID=2340860 RepID=UPI000EAB995A|nr:biotin/lipoyl-binding protein [Chachezhania antarctica]|tara:strand:+ start:2503 stop:3714 length:1212 start_codon:yes stop_codon:yes gene_type:complete